MVSSPTLSLVIREVTKYAVLLPPTILNWTYTYAGTPVMLTSASRVSSDDFRRPMWCEPADATNFWKDGVPTGTCIVKVVLANIPAEFMAWMVMLLDPPDGFVMLKAKSRIVLLTLLGASSASVSVP